jgi:hypothetical protein
MVADTMRRFGRSGSGQAWTGDGWAMVSSDTVVLMLRSRASTRLAWDAKQTRIT